MRFQSVPGRALALMTCMLFLAAGCSSSSSDSDATGSEVSGPRPTITFTAPDGSAAFPSRPVFTVTSVTTGEVIAVPVTGMAEATRTQVEVESGSYTITAPEPSIAGSATYLVRDFGPVNVTVGDGAAQDALIEFTVEVLAAPLALTVDRVDGLSVGLRWIGPDNVDEYVVRRTDGDLIAPTSDAGIAVDLDSSTTTSVLATDLQPDSTYTFTLFATSAGEALPVSSVAATTAGLDGSGGAYAVAPNTILPTDLAALEAEVVGESRVRVTLAPGNTDRASYSPLPGLEPGALEGGCVVGSPFLVSVDVAGEDGFFGLVESCDDASSPQGSDRAAEAGVKAVINTDVAVTSVLSYLSVVGPASSPCTAILADGSIVETDPGDCEFESDVPPVDSDGDGLFDADEGARGTDPENPDTDGDQLTDGDEVNEYGTDPLNVDSDFDRLFDDEILFFGTDPNNPDTDGDGCWDHGENVVGRNPLDPGDAGGNCFEPEPNWQTEVEQARAAAEAEQGGRPPQADLRETEGASEPQGFASSQRSIATGGTAALRDAAYARKLVTCEGEGQAQLTAVVTIRPDANIRKFELEPTSLDWDFDLTLTASFDAGFDIQGAYTCELDLGEYNVPIPGSFPIPVVLKVKPVVRGTSSAKIEITGPSASAEMVFTSNSWFSIRPLIQGECLFGRNPDQCPLNVNPKGKTSLTIPPRIKVETAEVTIEGELGIDIGALTTIAIGFNNVLAGAYAGLAFEVIPLAGVAKASTNGTTACAELSLGAKASVSLVEHAHLLAIEVDEELTIFEVDNITYPNLSYQLGAC